MSLFGTVTASRGGAELPLGSPAQRALFAVLALVAGRPVTHAELVAALWPQRPPAQAANVLQTYVKHLRRVLEPDRPARRASALLPRRGDGYTLDVPAEAVDVLRFKQTVDRARSLRRDGGHELVLRLLEPALAAEHDPPALDLPVLAGHPWVVEPERLRREAVGWYAEATLRAGRAVEALPVVEREALRPPADEAVHTWLIRLLSAAGRAADAVEVYHRVHRRLADELGIDAGQELRDAYVEALRSAGGAGALGAGGALAPGGAFGAGNARGALGAGGAAEPVAAPVPAQLPLAASQFTGRARALRRLDKMLAAAEAGDAGRIWTIVGPGGVGKTALAVHWAHRIRDRFPDGQLYLDLRGYGPDAPLDPGVALHRLLSTLGVPAAAAPPDREARSALLRSHLSGRRVLILLDNARQSDQVRPLLPGDGTALVLVTSRSQLRGLTAREGARRITVPQLGAQESVDLVARLVGGKRAAAEPAAVAALAELCGRLPLALRIAGERAERQYHVRLADLAADLRDSRDRLAALRAGDADAGAALSWSYRALPEPAARLFRLLGLHPAADFDAYAAAALTDTTPADAAELLDALGEVHLIERRGASRFGFHDLVREYARRLAADEPEPAREAAADRLTGYYVHTAATANDLVAPHKSDRRAPLPACGAATPAFPDLKTAGAWLDAERHTLLALAAHLAARDRLPELAALSGALRRYLEGCDPHDAVTLHGLTAATAERHDAPAAEGQARNRLGVAYWRLGRYAEALAELRSAQVLTRAAGDLFTERRAINNQGLVHRNMGRFDEALSAHRRALALAEAHDDLDLTAAALQNIGILHLRAGRLPQALDHCERALAAHRTRGNRLSQHRVMHDIGVIRRDLGQYTEAAATLAQALAGYREHANLIGAGHALLDLGLLHLAQHRRPQAVDHLQQALALGRETGERGLQTEALNALAEAARSAAAPDHSRSLYRAALALARNTGDRRQEARANEGLRDLTLIQGQGSHRA